MHQPHTLPTATETICTLRASSYTAKNHRSSSHAHQASNITSPGTLAEPHVYTTISNSIGLPISLRQWQIDPCVTCVYWYACCLVLHLNASTTHALFAHSLTDRHNSHVLTRHSCSPSLSIGWHNSRTGTYLKSTATPPSATEIRQPLWQRALLGDHMQSSRQ